MQLAEPVANGLQGLDRIRTRRLIDRNRRGGPTVEMGLAIEVGGAQFQPRDVAEPENRAVRVRADDDVGELVDARQPSFGLQVELELLIVRDRPGADAADRGLDVLRLNCVDDIAGGQVEAGQLVDLDPGTHRVILGPSGFPHSEPVSIGFNIDNRVMAEAASMLPSRLPEHREGGLGRRPLSTDVVDRIRE